MEQYKLNKITEFTKTETFQCIVELFEEKRKVAFDNIMILDLDNEEEKKEFQKKQNELLNFATFIGELRNIALSQEAQTEMSQVYDEEENYLENLNNGMID